MNKNIEVINENLWAVEFEYVKMGFIKEFTFNKVNGSDYATLTQDAKIILNKNKPIYKSIVRYLLIIMKMPGNQLACDKGFYKFIKVINTETKKFSDQEMELFIEKKKLNGIKQLFFNLSTIERERRRIQELYIKGCNQLRKGV